MKRRGDGMGGELSTTFSTQDLFVPGNGKNSTKINKASAGITRLVRDEYGRMINFVRNKLNDAAQQDAEDIVQDVFYSLVNRPDFTAPIENIVSYLYQSLRNRIVDFWRVRKNNDSLDSHQDEEKQVTLLDLIADNRYTADERVNQGELKTLLKAALSQLTNDERKIVLATELDGYTFNELSLMWNTPINTLLSRKSRAMIKIKEWIKVYRSNDTSSDIHM